MDPLDQIREATAGHDDRPLIVCDVDEVLLEFIRPFMAFLADNGFILDTSTYRLTGNVRTRADNRTADAEEVAALLERFFTDQGNWQGPVKGALAAMESLARDHNIVLLTAMAARHRETRRELLSRHGFDLPLVAADHDKGPLLRALAARYRQTAFIDDLPFNHHSVARHARDVARFHIMAFRDFASGLPPLPEGTHEADDWIGLEAAVRMRLGR